MDETKPYLEAERPEDFVPTVLKTINSCYEEVTITKVEGGCPYGHREGEQYRVTAMNHDGLCGSLYQAISPFLGSLHYGVIRPGKKLQILLKGSVRKWGGSRWKSGV